MSKDSTISALPAKKESKYNLKIKSAYKISFEGCTFEKKI
jgi:hypothetical protein